MPDIKFLKVKLLNGGQDGVEIKLNETGILNSKDTKECSNPAHEDFSTVMQKLALHLAVLTGSIPEKKCHENKEVLKFTVTGYSIGGKEGSEGFTITGYRITPFGTVILNSPFRRFEQDDETAYSMIDDVSEIIEGIEAETTEYINGKRAPNPQQSLFDQPDNDNEIDEDVNIPVPGKKINKIKVLPPADPADELEEKPARPSKTDKKKNDKTGKDDIAGKELSPQQLDEHLASRGKAPGGKKRPAKDTVRKNQVAKD